jgi:hypothetical protein
MDLYDQDIFAPLRKEFAADLPARLDVLRAFFHLWLEATDDGKEAVLGMIHESHKLSGTAGALGFSGIGDEMCLIERLLRAQGTDPVLRAETTKKVEESLVSCFRQAGLEFTEPDPSVLGKSDG